MFRNCQHCLSTMLWRLRMVCYQIRMEWTAGWKRVLRVRLHQVQGRQEYGRKQEKEEKKELYGSCSILIEKEMRRLLLCSIHRCWRVWGECETGNHQADIAMKLVEPDAAQQRQARSVIHEFDEKQLDSKHLVEKSLDASILANLHFAETQERRQLR